MNSRSQSNSCTPRFFHGLCNSDSCLAQALLTIALLAMTGFARADVRDAEIGGFRFTDISGSTSARFLLDDRAYASQNSSSNAEKQRNLEVELFILTRSYLYHPDFLNMKIGGGPLLVTQDYIATAGTNDTSEALFNFVVDLSFLDQKAYPVRTYYTRNHPSITTSLAGRFLVERNQYGLNAQLRQPISPVQFTFDAFHIDTIGSGFDTRLDENIDELSLTGFKSYRSADRLSVTYRWNQRDSLSGSPGLPIQASKITTGTTDVSARNVFGSDGQLELVQQLFLVDQDTEIEVLTKLEDRRYFGNLKWAHTGSTRSFYQYTDQQTTRPEQTEVSHRSLVVGGSHERGQNLIVTADATVTEDQDSAFDRQLMGIRSNIKYTYPTAFGSVSLGMGLGARNTDQVAGQDRAQVFDESIVLAGTDRIDLRNDFIVAETIIVRNVPKTQVFAEGIDYRLVTVGSSTSIQRLVGGNIADGQTVLLEYAYLTGGTVKFDTLSQNYVANIRFLNHFSAFARLSDRSNRIVSGDPTIPLNDVQSFEFGGRADYPLGNRWTIGGQYLHTDQNEDISSFIRDSYDAYAEVRMPLSSSLRLMVHRETIENEGSVEDVDLVQYRASLRSRPFRGIIVSWDSDYLEDVGGTLFRERISHNLTAQWMYRQMRIMVRGEFVSETLGSTLRDNARVTAQIQRSF